MAALRPIDFIALLENAAALITDGNGLSDACSRFLQRHRAITRVIVCGWLCHDGRREAGFPKAADQQRRRSNLSTRLSDARIFKTSLVVIDRHPSMTTSGHVEPRFGAACPSGISEKRPRPGRWRGSQPLRTTPVNARPAVVSAAGSMSQPPPKRTTGAGDSYAGLRVEFSSRDLGPRGIRRGSCADSASNSPPAADGSRAQLRSERAAPGRPRRRSALGQIDWSRDSPARFVPKTWRRRFDVRRHSRVEDAMRNSRTTMSTITLAARRCRPRVRPWWPAKSA